VWKASTEDTNIYDKIIKGGLAENLITKVRCESKSKIEKGKAKLKTYFAT